MYAHLYLYVLDKCKVFNCNIIKAVCNHSLLGIKSIFKAIGAPCLRLIHLLEGLDVEKALPR